MFWSWCASTCYFLLCAKVRIRLSISYLPITYYLLCNCLVNGEQSCAQGFQPWDMVDAGNWTIRNRQYLFPSLNFSCGGVISRWVLTRGRGLSVSPNNTIILQLWRQKARSESTYILQTNQTHTARLRDAASYVFTASPSMTVSSGDVFGCYVPSFTGLRMAAVTTPVYTAFFSHNARATEFTARNAELNVSPLISIDFSKCLPYIAERVFNIV